MKSISMRKIYSYLYPHEVFCWTNLFWSNDLAGDLFFDLVLLIEGDSLYET